MVALRFPDIAGAKADCCSQRSEVQPASDLASGVDVVPDSAMRFGSAGCRAL